MSTPRRSAHTPKEGTPTGPQGRRPPVLVTATVTVTVTGGARGIGRATAATFAATGARVAIGDLDTGLAARTAAELGDQVVGLPLDVTDAASFAGFLDAAEETTGAAG